MQEHEVPQSPVESPSLSPDEIRDCMQCLIVMYGETHIDTLAQLLYLTANAEAEYSHLRVRRLSEVADEPPHGEQGFAPPDELAVDAGVFRLDD
jgi:hypothetical protein